MDQPAKTETYICLHCKQTWDCSGCQEIKCPKDCKPKNIMTYNGYLKFYTTGNTDNLKVIR